MAASLGQVYKGRLKENGDLVAVKVQRPFVLETVTVDLFVIRNLGLVLRKFPQVAFSYDRVRDMLFCFNCFLCIVLILISPPPKALLHCAFFTILDLCRCGWTG